MGIVYNPLTGQLDFVGDTQPAIVTGTTPITGMADNSILYNNGGFVGGAGPLDDGQLLIGATGSDPAAANITGTSTIAVANGTNSITLSVPDAGITDIKIAAGIDAVKIADGSVTNSEFQFINSVTSNVQTQLNNKQPLDSTLTALAAYNTNGILTQTATDTFVGRTITGTTNQVVVTNGTGVSGNPTLSLPQDIATTSTPTFNQVTISTTPSASTDAATKGYVDTTFIPLTQRAAANGVATLDAGSKIPAAQLPNTVMEYQGSWSALTNSPTLIDGTGNAGDVYRVNVAGTQNLGSGSQTFSVGDLIIYSGSIWQRSPTADGVTSVNGLQGDVLLTTTNIGEGSNLYFTDERAQDAVGTILADSATIDFTYNDAGNSITAIVIDASITNAKVTTGIDAIKIGAGSVDNTEFSYLDGVTSAIQTQLNSKTTTNVNDIAETSFIGANNVSSATNVTGFAFSNAAVRSFTALASVTVIATSSLYEEFQIVGIQKGSSWDISISNTGDVSNVLLTITTAGQIQYTSPSFAGFTSLTIKFRAITTSV